MTINESELDFWADIFDYITNQEVSDSNKKQAKAKQLVQDRIVKRMQALAKKIGGANDD